MVNQASIQYQFTGIGNQVEHFNSAGRQVLCDASTLPAGTVILPAKAPSAESLIAKGVAEIKSLCQNKIIQLIPGATSQNHIYKQLKILTTITQLSTKTAPLSASDQTLLNDSLILMGKIEALASASNLIEAELAKDLNYDYVNSPLWGI